MGNKILSILVWVWGGKLPVINEFIHCPLAATGCNCGVRLAGHAPVRAPVAVRSHRNMPAHTRPRVTQQVSATASARDRNSLVFSFQVLFSG
jgi:hypothetical protein